MKSSIVLTGVVVGVYPETNEIFQPISGRSILTLPPRLHLVLQSDILSQGF